VRKALVRIFAAAALLWVLGFALWVVMLPGKGDPVARTDAIVVMTGGPGRLDRGIALLRAGRAKRLLVSGVDRTVRPHELAATVDAPLALFDCCVDLGREAVDTRSNADETARWARKRGYRSIRLVTSAWHMPRARLELAARLPDDVKIISDAVPGERPAAAMSREYTKYVLRLMAVWMGIV
jgi:uncharacterized SAM-binding protein YcdF (DUF218 family)